jgi:hypothetical protein
MIKKRNLYRVTFILLSILISTTIVFGFSFLEFFEKTSQDIISITGMATSQNEIVNLTLTGLANGDIYFVENRTTQSITDNTFTNVTISFYINDPDGASTVAPERAQVNFTKPDRAFGAARGTIFNYSSGTSGGCFSSNNINATSANVTCSVHVWYFDPAGEWNISVIYRAANGSGESQNLTHNFSLASTTAIQIAPTNISFAETTAGANNATSSSDPIVVNNTGNVAATSGNVRINGQNLTGETTTTQSIPAYNFTMEVVNSTTADANAGCRNDLNASTVPDRNGSVKGISNSVLAVGNHSINNGTSGLEHIFVCLVDVPLGISAQAYSTLSLGVWVLDVV